MEAKYFTVKELLEMTLSDLPKTSAGMHQKINREGWQVKLRGGQGGKAGGTREYQPPPEVLALIEARQSGELTADDKVGERFANQIRKFEKPGGLRYISVTLLARCLDAVDEMASSRNLKPLTTEQRLVVAIEAYRELTELVMPEPLDYDAYCRLGTEEFAAAATFALWSAHIDENSDEKKAGDSWTISSF